LIGRRVETIDELARPGDTGGFEDNIFFVPPNAPERDDHPIRSGWLHRVCQPPHTFRECDDGSVEIRASIKTFDGHNVTGWHGFLDEGHVWRTT